MGKPNVIEKAKNLILVVLFISTVLLLYFFWGNISFDNVKIPVVQRTEAPLETASLLQPDRITVNFGADAYTVLPPAGIWYSDPGSDKDSFVKELGRFGPAENILVEEIPYDKYRKVMEYESIWARFNYDIPTADFCAYFNMSKPQSYDVIETVTEIGYSAAEKGDSLYILDGKNQKTYRLVAAAVKDSDNKTGNTDFPAFIESIGAEGYNMYYPVGSVLGVSNDTLAPLSVQTNLKSFSFRQDFYSYQTEKIASMAEPYFGGNFDFVRNITEENGTIIYMYGYGQTVLIVNTDGSIEYKEEQTANIAGQSFSEALETAVKFVSEHGAWESISKSKLTPYLEDVIRDPNKEKGYRFVFGLEVNGSRLYYEKEKPVVVDVTSGQVTYYKRQFIDFDQKEIDSISASSSDEAFSVANLIAQNYKYIYDILFKSGEVTATADQAVMFENIASLVKDMRIGYVKPADSESTEIRPVWVVTVKDTDVYFDLYSADPVGYSKE
jgi:hypothetical protein